MMGENENADGAEFEADANEVVAALQAENAALKDQVLRYAAEADNTKRRAEKEANDARAYAIQRFARDLLDAADSLSRAVAHAPKASADPAVNTFVQGVELTEKSLQNAFDRNGLKLVNPAKGEKFDPNLHQAMMEQPGEGVPPGSVIQVLQTGYALFGRIVRPAMVVVTPKAPAGAAPASPYAEAPAGGGETVNTKA
jgi:molecular chaperone GrpE